jgi:hypothetical protein
MMGLLGLWTRNIGEKKEKSAMEDSHRELAQSPLSPLVVLLHFCFLIFIPKKRGKLFCDVSTALWSFSLHQYYDCSDYNDCDDYASNGRQEVLFSY